MNCNKCIMLYDFSLDSKVFVSYLKCSVVFPDLTTLFSISN